MSWASHRFAGAERPTRALLARRAAASRSNCGASRSAPRRRQAQPGEDLRLGAGDARLAVGEVLDVGRPDVVTTACGATKRTSGVISPAWFMPISNTARAVVRGILARVSGTPMWLL